MYIEPKNDYEIQINQVYEKMIDLSDRGFFARLDSGTYNLDTIYKNLPGELQIELWKKFYTLYHMIGPDSIRKKLQGEA